MTLIFAILSPGGLMADNSKVFIVRDKVEALEKLVDQVLHVDGLHNLASEIVGKTAEKELDISRKQLDNIVEEAKAIIDSKKEVVVLDVDKRLDAAKTELQKAIVEHVKAVEKSMVRIERMARLALILAVLSAAWSGLSSLLGS